MSPLALGAIALLLGLLIGGSVLLGAPILFGFPAILIVLMGLGLYHFRTRAERARDMETFREQAAEEKTEFTARDRETLAD